MNCSNETCNDQIEKSAVKDKKAKSSSSVVIEEQDHGSELEREDCIDGKKQQHCISKILKIPMFHCGGEISTRTSTGIEKDSIDDLSFYIHYTLVCDHIQHCPGGEDEDLCYFPECQSHEFHCGRGQCVPRTQLCDRQQNCANFLDELSSVCTQSFDEMYLTFMAPPARIDMDGVGHYFMEKMNSGEDCPGSHFLCPDELCLPVYLRCNGVPDCLGEVDELNCESYTCPGYYKCWKSQVSHTFIL